MPIHTTRSRLVSMIQSEVMELVEESDCDGLRNVLLAKGREHLKLDIDIKEIVDDISWQCALEDNIECAKILIEAGIDINRRDFRTGNTALHIAADNGDIDMISLLLELDRIMINPRNKKGKTPYEIAVANEWNSAIEILKSAGGKIVRRKRKSSRNRKGDGSCRRLG